MYIDISHEKAKKLHRLISILEKLEVHNFTSVWKKRYKNYNGHRDDRHLVNLELWTLTGLD